jgi:hypothetical protein
VFLQMNLRYYDCLDCGKPCKSTSPNAVRCATCSKAWATQRNREYQRRRYAAIKKAQATALRGTAGRINVMEGGR